MKKLNILIVDDTDFIREGIKLSLKKGSWETIIHEACNGLEALELTINNYYDIILMDISMPIMDGKEAIDRILKQKPNQKIIVVSMHSDKEEIEIFRKKGAKGYVLKEDITKEIVKTIDRVLLGDLVFDLVYY